MNKPYDMGWGINPYTGYCGPDDHMLQDMDEAIEEFRRNYDPDSMVHMENDDPEWKAKHCHPFEGNGDSGNQSDWDLVGDDFTL